MYSNTLRAVLAAGVAFMATATPSSFAHTVLFQGKTVEIEETMGNDGDDLWVIESDLFRVTGFEVKPEGACLGDICIPLPESNTELVSTRGNSKWINASVLAKKVQQAVAHDADNGVWSFGQVPAAVQSTLGSAIAPDFALKDRDGKTVHLSDFRGKKVLLMTWASW